MRWFRSLGSQQELADTALSVTTGFCMGLLALSAMAPARICASGLLLAWVVLGQLATYKMLRCVYVKRLVALRAATDALRYRVYCAERLGGVATRQVLDGDTTERQTIAPAGCTDG